MVHSTVPEEELMSRKQTKIKRFCETGGPCSGKSTALAIIVQRLLQTGYRVMTIREAPTDVFTGGVRLSDFVGNESKTYEFQRAMVLEQIARQESMRRFTHLMTGKKKVEICDRGVPDIQAYIDKDMFSAILSELNLSLTDVREEMYDAVFHLQTAAEGAEPFYNLDNLARTETPDQARELDKRIIQAWNGHEHLRVINNTRIRDDLTFETIDFDQKMNWLLAEICSALGIPVPLEIESKYLLSDDINPESLPVERHVSEIEQFYLVSADPKLERRIRLLTPLDAPGLSKTLYIYNEKRKISERVRIETERILSPREYLNLRSQRYPGSAVIRKRRYSFVWHAQYFQLDIIREPVRRALLEVELTTEQSRVVIPPFLRRYLQGEVTDDPTYKNHAMAMQALA